jgi:hypothetical protein
VTLTQAQMKQHLNSNLVIIENNLYSNGKNDKLEITIDKFEMLTKQQAKPKNTPEATPTASKWSPLPKLKITKSKGYTRVSIKGENKNRMKLQLEQRLIVEQKTREAAARRARVQELLKKRTKETLKRIKEQKVNQENCENQIVDKWSSDDIRDINLQREIINTFYSLNNRKIRYGQNSRPDFFNLNKKNNAFDEVFKLMLDEKDS